MSSVARGIAVGRGLVRRGQSSVAISACPSVFVSAPTPLSSTLLASRRISRTVSFRGVVARTFSDAGKASSQPEDEVPLREEGGEGSTAAAAGDADGTTSADGGEAAPSEPSREEELESQVKDLKDQLLRSLAEQENTRRIAKRDVSAAKSFAVTSFAKSLLDTSDNLSRAMESVPPEYRTDSENHPVLATLYEGIKMTDDGLTKAFAKNGLIKFGEPGEKFDPNLHEALYEYVDPEREAGTVGQVMKVGFMLNERVVRPAEVGVVKKA